MVKRDSNWYKEWFLHDQGKNVKVEWVNIFILPHQEFLLTLCLNMCFEGDVEVWF